MPLLPLQSCPQKARQAVKTEIHLHYVCCMVMTVRCTRGDKLLIVVCLLIVICMYEVVITAYDLLSVDLLSVIVEMLKLGFMSWYENKSVSYLVLLFRFKWKHVFFINCQIHN